MKSKIEITVSLDENKIPEKLEWSADADKNPPQEIKAFSLALFDKETLDTLKIDLWTKEMQVVEMDRFMFQTLRSLADTYFKATSNEGLANNMRQFVDYFGEQTGIIPTEN